MVKFVNNQEPWCNGIFNQSYPTTFGYESQDSPLDLSKNSKHFPFQRPMSIDESLTAAEDSCVKSHNIIDRQMAINYPYEAPQIITQPKSDWHYRSMKDLAKKHIPFLSGEGPQRTPIRIKVPERCCRTMYLCITVVTLDNQSHDSKVIVPPKTRARQDQLSHDNNLRCLDFDECNSTDYFDSITKRVYLQINPEEHKSHLKEVRIHMFNLYQNQMITKDIIEAKHLDLCRLAFSLCILENDKYMCISPPSFSSIIREKKGISRPRVSQAMNNQKNSYSQFLIDSLDYGSQDNKNDDSDHDFDCSQ
ncbi:unnamed protein product [Rotaria sordida]|uniref:Uncharacterized protein n=1 Tax=Rotaria sordida TaxID=392033 RepID=A0A814F861_9BILA|nr:unnamed protein product [Rotaria sordida]CAF0979356.1 unnamed protein product [Rotaria sordida]